MTGLLGIEKVRVPRQILTRMRERLAEVGLRGEEAFALWAGRRIDDRTFDVSSLVIPGQQAHRTEAGVCVTVPGSELHRLNVWLYEHEMELVAQVAQVHTHPSAAYHSETDDSFPIVATVGAFSLVLPDFAIRPFSWNEIAVYRLDTNGNWCELNENDVRGVFMEL
jgi:hypothetical protein